MRIILSIATNYDDWYRVDLKLHVYHPSGRLRCSTVKNGYPV